MIREAVAMRPHVVDQATRVTSSLNLEAFKAEIARMLGAAELLAGIGDGLDVLHYSAKARCRPTGNRSAHTADNAALGTATRVLGNTPYGLRAMKRWSPRKSSRRRCVCLLVQRWAD